MSADFFIRGDTKLDTKGFEGAVSKLGSVAKKGLGVIVGATAAAVTALGTAGVASVKLASDLTEVQNVVDVTFGDNASSIDKWAKSAATAFGLSELQAKQFNGTMGAMLKSMGLTDSAILDMSTSMVGLAGDFASFYNLNAETAFQKIRSGISGETEPLKELGINMSVANLEAFALSQGIDKAYNSMTQAEQATLRYNYLMSTTADAQGDFARTSDSLANQLRIASLQIQDLGGSIGASLLPMVNQGLQAANKMLAQLKEGFQTGGFDGLMNAFQSVTVQAAEGLASAAPKLVETAVSLMESFTKGIVQALPQLLPAAGQILQALVSGLIRLAPTVFSALQQIGSMILSAIQSILPNVASGVATFLQTMLPQLLSFTGSLREKIGELVDIGLQLIKNLWSGIVQSLPVLIQNVPQIITNIAGIINDNFPKILATGLSMMWELLKGLIAAIPDIIAALPQIIEAIVAVFMAFNWVSLGNNIITMLKNGIVAMKGAAGQAAKSIFETVKNAIINLPQTLGVIAKNAMTSLTTGIRTLLYDAKLAGVDVFTVIRSVIAELPSALASIGSSAISFLSNGITGMLGIVKNATSSILSGIISALKALPDKLMKIGKNAISELWKVFTDSKFEKLGDMIIQGIIGGISAAWNGLTNWFNNLWNGLFGNRTANVHVNTTETRTVNTVQGSTKGRSINGSHANGLDRVPFDGYIAELHEGEMVVPKKQASLLRRVQALSPLSAQAMLDKARAALYANNVPGSSLALAGSGVGSAVNVNAALQTNHTTIVELDGRTVGKVIAPYVDEFLF